MELLNIKKVLGFLFIILISSSCAHKLKRKEVFDPLKDSLRKESLMRYTEERLRPYLSHHSPYKELSSCHAGEFKTNLLLLKRKILKGPGNNKVLNDLGVCYYLKGDLNLSHYHLSMGLTNTTTKDKILRSKLFNNRGLIYLKWKNYKLAYINLKRSIKEYKNSHTAHYNLAQLYLKFGDSSKASYHLDQIPNAEEDSDVIISKAYAHILKKDFKKALRLLNKLEKKEEKRKDVKAYRNYLDFKLGKPKGNEKLKTKIERYES